MQFFVEIFCRIKKGWVIGYTVDYKLEGKKT
jgi:hypothetical protein